MRTSLLCTLFVALVTSCAAPRSQPPPPAAATTPAPETVDYDTLVKTAQAYAQTGKTERAGELVARAVAQNAERPEAYVVWGLLLAQERRLDESAAKYELALARGSKNRELFVELASVYDVSRRYDEAVRVYMSYLAIAPDDLEMRQELGLTYLLLDRPEAAVNELSECAAKRPDDLQVQQDLGYALMKATRHADAVTVLTRVVQIDANRPEAVRILARCLAATGRGPEALGHLDRLLLAWPDDAKARRMRARLRLLTDNAALATEDYRELLAKKPDDTTLLLGAAGAFIALGKLEEADQTLDLVRQALGNHPQLEFREAQIAWRRGSKHALNMILQFARDNPTEIEAWREVHQAAEASKDKKLSAEAATHLKALGDDF